MPPRFQAAAPVGARASTVLLEKTLAGFRGDLTVADAATRGGLALRDAEAGLRGLAATRGGQLKATSTGELIYSFPKGLSTPRAERWPARWLRRLGRACLGVGRFVVRAWVSIVMVGYALGFVVIAIGLSARDDDGEGIGGAVSLVGQVLLETLYWTFNPFSPLALGFQPTWRRGRLAGRRGPRVPFHERVNRFVFGPPRAAIDPREHERRVLSEIRRLDGRAGPGDMMRVTGCDRATAERALLRMVVDYDGDIQVSDGGALIYAFKDLRTTADAATDSAAEGPAGRRLASSSPAGSAAASREAAVRPIWTERVELAPLTGNPVSSNLLLMAINGVNLAGATFAIAAGLTVDQLSLLLTRVTHHAEIAAGLVELPPLPPPDGAALLFGWIPLIFSSALFGLPIVRALGRRRAARRVIAENAKRLLLRLLLDEPACRHEISAGEAERAWRAAGDGTTRARPPTGEIEAAVRSLGGEIDLGADGTIVYRFDDFARERLALAQARAQAAPDEARPGEIIFSSADPGDGLGRAPRDRSDGSADD